MINRDQLYFYTTYTLCIRLWFSQKQIFYFCTENQNFWIDWWWIEKYSIFVEYLRKIEDSRNQNTKYGIKKYQKCNQVILTDIY